MVPIGSFKVNSINFLGYHIQINSSTNLFQQVISSNLWHVLPCDKSFLNKRQVVYPNPPAQPLSTRYKGKAAPKRPHCSQKYATIRLYGPKSCWLKTCISLWEKSVYLL